MSIIEEGPIKKVRMANLVAIAYLTKSVLLEVIQ